MRQYYIKAISAIGTILTLVNFAHATGAISCSSDQNNLDINIILGAGPVPNIFSVSINSDDYSYSTQQGGSEQRIFLARSYLDKQRLQLDFMDSQVLTHIATIDVVRHFDADSEPFQIGYARIGNYAPIGIRCDGP